MAIRPASGSVLSDEPGAGSATIERVQAFHSPVDSCGRVGPVPIELIGWSGRNIGAPCRHQSAPLSMNVIGGHCPACATPVTSNP
jgi:hypothetical protein